MFCLGYEMKECELYRSYITHGRDEKYIKYSGWKLEVKSALERRRRICEGNTGTGLSEQCGNVYI